MESPLRVDLGAGSATESSYEAVSAPDSGQPFRAWQFVSEFQQLVGDDSEPDPLFFVDTWTLGMGAAVDRLKQRRQTRVSRERKDREFHDFESLGVRAFLEENDLYAEFVAEPPAGEESDDGGQAPQESSAQTAYQTSQEWEQFAGGSVRHQQKAEPMTEDRARQILGVTRATSGKQIKSAYHRLVGQWHPDRLEYRSEQARQLATDRMAAINEAYHLLRSLES